MGLFFVLSTRCLQGEYFGSGQVKQPENTSNTCPAQHQEVLRGGEEEGAAGGREGHLMSEM